MMTSNFDGRRVDIAATKSFEEVAAAFERRVPVHGISELIGLVDLGASREQIEDAVNKMIGDLGFMAMFKLESGSLTSLLGVAKKMTIYLLGNPLLATRMYEQYAAVGMYAPLRAVIYEDHDGTTHFTYDLPSAGLGQFKSNEIQTVARLLDDRMRSLAESLAS